MCFYSQTADQRLLGFFRDYARKKWPLRGSEKPEIPPLFKRGAKGDLSRLHGKFPSYQHAGISWALSS